MTRKEAYQFEYEPTTKNDLGVEKIVDVLGSYTDLDIPYKHKIAEDILNSLPSVTPIRPEAHWIPTYGNVECSVCGNVKDSREVGKATHYCDFCGAKMVEPQAESEGT